MEKEAVSYTHLDVYKRQHVYFCGCGLKPRAPFRAPRGGTVNLASNLRKVAAFFWRDFAIARGYRGALLLETIEALFGVATFYYLSRFVQSPELSSELPAGANYFAFALVGFAFFD